ncbi:N-formylglutamate amidohydrolase [Chthonobacter albigriseus]|uniref:N-formylglutamate amidohydrolase n=1 Tax=Chthonobacter albigriseus TaxID=1683161 RepID=UPI001FCE5C5C|nr:N-formylglutamate amidohydrolase [Chthonobacter albigriseus]
MTPAPFDPIEFIDGSLSGGLLLICDHASNALPEAYGSLGLPASEFSRHIAYDIGAAWITRRLAARFGAPALLTRYSRLLIDPNRGEDDPTLVMRLSDGAVVPGNARIDDVERQARIDRFHRPYHHAINQTLDAMAARGTVPVIVSIHSFTDAWKGVPRPWHVGVLWDTDDRLNRPLIDALGAAGDLVVGDNEPYDGALLNDTLYRHGTARGFAHTLIEVRQDLIAEEAAAYAWADRLHDCLAPILADPHLHTIRTYGSRALQRALPPGVTA